jgi:tetratricopeptide (TPR) repeat protein
LYPANSICCIGHHAHKLLVPGVQQVQNYGSASADEDLDMGTHPKLHGSQLIVILSLKRAALSGLFIVLFYSALVVAQRSPACRGCPALRSSTVNLPRFPDARVVVDRGGSVKPTREQKLCSIQPFPELANAASVDSLEVPPKAQKEYGAACSAVKSNRLAAAEQHLRKAVQIYPKYVAGWVMLGQILEAQQQPDRARSACLQASEADPNYLASYLCLAEIAGREEKWGEVLRHTTRALELDPVHSPYAYFFSAIAYFHLNQFAEAEQRALKAGEIDREHHEPRVQFLLGQIYKAKNEPMNAAAQLREYLKYAPNAKDSEAVKKDLAQLDSGESK